jgi:threonine synthase
VSVAVALTCTECDGVAVTDPGVTSEGASPCRCVPTPNRRVRYTGRPPSVAALRDVLHGTDLWRYEALLPARGNMGSKLQVGGTPLLDLGTVDGVTVHGKDETRNPSGSLKDRATEVVLAVARELGVYDVVGASTGNAGASLACLAAAQGMRATVVVPASAPEAKLRQIQVYGADLITVDGTYDDAFDHALLIAERDRVICRNTGVNPFCREGKKTCAFEIAEQLGWAVPDWVVVPTGDGNILSGIAAGFQELADLGWTSRVPRLVAAQAVTSDSIGRTFEIARAQGSVPRVPVPASPRTIADSISVARPRDHFAAVDALLRSGGLARTVSDARIGDASRELARRFGLWVEPSSATAFAVLTDLVAAGTIVRGESVVVLLTGSGLKDPTAFADGAMS